MHDMSPPPPLLPPLSYILDGLATTKARQSLRDLDNQGADFFCRRSPWRLVELDHVCGVETLTPHKGNGRITQCDSVYMARHPRGSYVVLCTHCCLWQCPNQDASQWFRRCHPHANFPPQMRRCLVGCSSPFMRLAQHLARLRAWSKQCLLSR